MSESAANLEVGSWLFQYHFAEGAEAGIKKLGIHDLLQILASADGEKFLDACKYLNTANEDIDRNKEATARAVKRYLRFFTADTARKKGDFRKLARFAARLHLFAFQGLEALSAFNHPRTMAQGVRAVGAECNLPRDTKAWLKNPEDQDAMVWSFVAIFHEQKLSSTRKRSRASVFEEWEELVAAPSWGPSNAAAPGVWDENDETEEPCKGVLKRKKTSGKLGKAARRGGSWRA